MRAFVLCVLLLFSTVAIAQQTINGIVADSVSRQPLPFATVQAGRTGQAVISGIDGKFVLFLKGATAVQVSYSGHRSRTFSVDELKAADTLFLSPLLATLAEVVIRQPTDKISHIINTAIAHKPQHNPDQYPWYECNTYYKMIVDMKAYGGYNMDSIRRRQDSLIAVRAAKRKRKDTASSKKEDITFALPSHMFMTETYSKRLYKKPGQTQEVILASKMSGLPKTYFANIITDVLPFHVYSDYISLNNIDFINPIAKGWPARYRFTLEDEITVAGDTVFILRYRPKTGTSFNSLTGLLYINTKGYAITHFTGTNSADSTANRFVKLEQIYQQVEGRWFPQELNYNFGIRKVPLPYTQIVWNGHSVIDSVRFTESSAFRIDKARPVKFGDSIDLHTTNDWERFRKDTLSTAEANTYRNMDTVMKKTGMAAFIEKGTRLATGRFPIGAIDIDVQRLFATNQYEGTRLGLGLYTNDRLSKWYSVGGWWGYGFKDKVAKYGGSFTLFPKKDKDNWLSFSFDKTYRLTGEVALHPELSQSFLNNWLLLQVDEIKEYRVSANIKPGYWELQPSFAGTDIGPLHYSFTPESKTVSRFTTTEATLRLRYAYGEKRVPFFEYFIATGTNYPVVYASLSRGHLSATGYQTPYSRALAAITYAKHFNRWGADRFYVEGGLIRSDDNKALPRSLLLAGRGIRREGLNFYSWGGFITMQPFDFYSDRYVSLFYKHDL
ncbi:MAG TPA: DUF5686 family protein, partial [Fibrella sp.]